MSPSARHVVSSRLLVVALCGAFALPALAATPLDTRRPRETITLDYLMESCTVIGETAYGMVPHFDCESFLYGVIDAHAAAEAARGDERLSCVPADLAPWQLYERIGDGVPRERWGEPAAPLVLALLTTAWPCKS